MKVSIFPDSNISKALSVEFGYNEWMISRYLEFIPSLKECLLAMEISLPKYIRINTLKISKYDLIQRLVKKDVVCEETILDDVLLIKKFRYPIGAMTEYLLGYYYIQDLTSCLAVEELDISPNQFNLDMASAPGGKTSFISQKMKNFGCVVALEPSSRRIRALKFNLSRCGVSNTCIYKLDGSFVERLGLKFDRILLDAPCSCEGIIAKDPLIKTNLIPRKIESCMLRQVELLRSAIKVIKPGGLIIYSTCTFAPEENELVINNLLETNTNIKIEPQKFGERGLIKYGDIKLDNRLVDTRRFYPHFHNTSGFFIAKIRVLEGE